MTKERFKKAEFVAWSDFIGNLTLALLKGCIGLLANSKALFADGMHTASGAIGSFANIRVLRTDKQPPHEDHLNKQGKIERTSSVIISVLISIVGIEIGISAIKSLYYGVDTPPEEYAIIAIIVLLLLKEALFYYISRFRRKYSSYTVITNAWDHKSSVYSSLAALAGTTGAWLGKLFGIHALYYLDPLASIVVAVLIVIMGYQILQNGVYHHSVHERHKVDADILKQAVLRVNGVITVDDLRTKEHGHYVIVDMKISVNPRISVIEGNDIAKEVKAFLMDRYFHVTDVNIHVHPYDPGYPYKNNLEIEQKEISTMVH
jgi:cation diffusion facilitator family transporter